MNKNVLNLEQKIAKEIFENLESYEGVYGCDLAYEMFNSDYYIIGTYRAKQFLKENIDELFEALEEYEFEFGEQYPNITNAEKLATLVALNEGKKVLNNLETLEEKWNETIEEEEIEKIKNELKEIYDL